MEKIDPATDAVEQLDLLRTWCFHLCKIKKAKKSGKKRIAPPPLFSKDPAVNGYINSIDIGTGSAFLAGKILNPSSATKLMKWLESNFPWIIASEEELQQQQEQQWAKLVENDRYHQPFMGFKLPSNQGLKCINIDNLLYGNNSHLVKININERFYLDLSGDPNDCFFILLESFSDNKVLMQMAPLIPSRLLPRNTFTSIIQPNRKSLRYPIKTNIQFSEKYGLGKWRCTAIRSETLPITAKALDSGDLLLTSQQLAQFVALLIHQDNDFVVDKYEFMLVE